MSAELESLHQSVGRVEEALVKVAGGLDDLVKLLDGHQKAMVEEQKAIMEKLDRLTHGPSYWAKGTAGEPSTQTKS